MSTYHAMETVLKRWMDFRMIRRVELSIVMHIVFETVLNQQISIACKTPISCFRTINFCHTVFSSGK